MPGTDQGNGDTVGSSIRFNPFSHCPYGLEEETDTNEIIKNTRQTVKLVQRKGRCYPSLERSGKASS